jgi:hypothetical protein
MFPYARTPIKLAAGLVKGNTQFFALGSPKEQNSQLEQDEQEPEEKEDAFFGNAFNNDQLGDPPIMRVNHSPTTPREQLDYLLDGNSGDVSLNYSSDKDSTTLTGATDENSDDKKDDFNSVVDEKNDHAGDDNPIH